MEQRRVSLLIGRKSYSLRTMLDDRRLQEVSTLLSELVRQTDAGADQDERLVVVGLMLAEELISIEERLRAILETARPEEDESVGGTEE